MAVLSLIGVVAAVGRATFVGDFTTRAERGRHQALRLLDREDPFPAARAAAVARLDRRFGAHPVPTLLHVVPGGLFLLLAPFQFSSRIRRHIGFHRWSGRLLLVAGFVSGLPGLYFGLYMPFGGRGEAAAIGLFGGLFFVSMGRAFVTIRKRDVARHREWMIRSFAIAIGIAAVRVAGAVLDLALTPAGIGVREIFVLSLWAGWVLTLGAAELWIRHTRPCASSAPLAASAA